jgi:hypothetical protein
MNWLEHERPKDMNPHEISNETLEKLRKLLRMSASTNEHEAALALSRAQEIAVRHQIDLASVRVEDRPKQTVEKEMVSETHNKQQKFIHWLLRGHFNVHLVWVGGSKKRQVWFIGEKTDILFAQWVSEYLTGEFPRLWLAYKRRNMIQADTARVTYYYGLWQGLDAKLTAAKQEAFAAKMSEVKQESGEERASVVGQSYALAIVDRKKNVEQAVKEFFPNTIKGRKTSIKIRDTNAQYAGVSAGRNINLNRPIESGSRQFALA